MPINAIDPSITWQELFDYNSESETSLEDIENAYLKLKGENSFDLINTDNSSFSLGETYSIINEISVITLNQQIISMRYSEAKNVLNNQQKRVTANAENNNNNMKERLQRALAQQKEIITAKDVWADASKYEPGMWQQIAESTNSFVQGSSANEEQANQKTDGFKTTWSNY